MVRALKPRMETRLATQEGKEGFPAGQRRGRRIRRRVRALVVIAAGILALTGMSAFAVARTSSPRASHGTPGHHHATSGDRRVNDPRPSASVAGPRPFRPGVLIVGFRPGVSARRQHLIAAHAGGAPGRVAAPGIRLINVEPGHEKAALRRLDRQGASLRFAEPDYVMRESAATVYPNDSSFGLQWGFRNSGQSVNGVSGTSGADEHVGAAWGMTTGSRSVVIAETDSGVDYNHPDLAANVWSNPGGVGGCAAGTRGYNVLTATCDPMDDETSYGGHGTHVAGILGAQGNNGVGVTGVNWATSILPVKWLDSSGWGSTSGLISALNWVLQAKQAGINVRVVNESATFVGTAYSQALSDEIDALGAQDILFVTAAGNTGDNNDNPTVRRYPCGYDRPTEICATASDQYDQKPSWANYGATTVDLAAPGANIYSTLRNGAYGYISGGSMASPQVAGTAALVLSRGYMSATNLRADILNNVDPLPSLNGLVRTGGRLNVCKALPGCSGAPVAPPSNTSLPVVSGRAQVGQVLSASTGSWSGAPTGYAYQWSRCDSSGASCSLIGGATASSYALAGADVGATIRVVVTASNSAGSSSATSAQTAVVQAVPAAPSTFGKTSVGASSDSMAANRKRVNAYSVSSSAAVSKLSIYLQPTGTSGQQALRGVIYADSGGAPGALVAVSNELSFASTQAAGWYDLALPGAVTLSPGRYWIGMVSGGSSYVAGFRWDSVSASRVFNSNTYTSGPTNPFGAVGASDSEQMSIYATYTAG